MKNNPVVNVEKALMEKKERQKIFVRDHSYPSSVLALLITYFENEKEKNKRR